MDTFGDILRKQRSERGLTLKNVSDILKIDQAILSKVERGQRRLTRDQVTELAHYFKIDEENLLVEWLSEKLFYEVADEKIAIKALQAAEERVAYSNSTKFDRKTILRYLKQEIKKFPMIQEAWIYGSFSRQEDDYKSDIDVAIRVDAGFSYFDLADVQIHLEEKVKRTVDIGFIDSFKPHIFEYVKPDLKLIYERSA